MLSCYMPSCLRVALRCAAAVSELFYAKEQVFTLCISALFELHAVKATQMHQICSLPAVHNTRKHVTAWRVNAAILAYSEQQCT
jgi:hypothetical protein